MKDAENDAMNDISARCAESPLGGIRLDINGYGGAFDGGGSVATFTAELVLSPETAYRVARELCEAANLRLEQLRAESPGYADYLSRVTPHIVVPARKLTDEERAARATSRPMADHDFCPLGGDHRGCYHCGRPQSEHKAL